MQYGYFMKGSPLYKYRLSEILIWNLSLKNNNENENETTNPAQTLKRPPLMGGA